MAMAGVTHIECWFSGGMDSALACFLAHRCAQVVGTKFRLLHIDTTIALPQTQEYVHRYAEWLGAELVVLRPRHSFDDLIRRYPYWPYLRPVQYRWCYYKLKLDALLEYLHSIRSRIRETLWVLGIRQDESLFRAHAAKYQSPWTTLDYEGTRVRVWMPLLKTPKRWVVEMIRRFGIPRNPVWEHLGTSGECLCMAGMPRNTLDRLIAHYPEVAMRLARLDEELHKHRRNPEPSYPPPLKSLRIRLSDYVRQRLRQRLDMYLSDDYVGKACQGECMLPPQEEP